MGVQEWRELAQDRVNWKDLAMAAKTLSEYLGPDEKEDNDNNI